MSDPTLASPDGEAVKFFDLFQSEAQAVFDRNPERYFSLAGDGKTVVTERHSADLFVDTYGSEVKFVQTDKRSWYICSRTQHPGYWSKEDRLGTQQRMLAVLRVLSQVAGNIETIGRAKSRLELAKSDLALSPVAFNSDPMILGVRNGVVHLETGLLSPLTPEMLMTKYADVDYDPAWTNPAHAASHDTWAECPSWTNHLRVMLRQDVDYYSEADSDELNFLQELVGMTLVGDQNRKEHAFVYLYGGGRNGKGVFVETLRHILGKYTGEIDAQILFRKGYEHTTGFVDLMGTRFATFNEVPRGQIDTATLKRITGGGVLKGRHIAQDNVEWEASHTLWMASNFPPNFGVDNSVGLWSRVILVPTGPPIPKDHRSKDIIDELRAEGPQILAWAVEGAVHYLKRGRLPDMPDRFKRATDTLEESSDLLGRFLEERYVREPEAKTLMKEIRAAYVTWLQDEGELDRFDKGPSTTELRHQLDERGIKVAHGTGNKLFAFSLKPTYIAD